MHIKWAFSGRHKKFSDCAS